MRLKVSPLVTATQATSKSTAVTCDGRCGQITLNGAALAASTSVGFTVNNVHVNASDTVVLNIGGGATAASYFAAVDSVAAGSFTVHLRNITAGSLSEAVVLNFSVIRNFA